MFGTMLAVVIGLVVVVVVALPFAFPSERRARVRISMATYLVSSALRFTALFTA